MTEQRKLSKMLKNLEYLPSWNLNILLEPILNSTWSSVLKSSIIVQDLYQLKMTLQQLKCLMMTMILNQVKKKEYSKCGLTHLILKMAISKTYLKIWKMESNLLNLKINYFQDLLPGKRSLNQLNQELSKCKTAIMPWMLLNYSRSQLSMSEELTLLMERRNLF